jgi:hypothetical protein
MSFNRWQKLMAASTENAVVVAWWVEMAGEALTGEDRQSEVREA